MNPNCNMNIYYLIRNMEMVNLIWLNKAGIISDGKQAIT